MKRYTLLGAVLTAVYCCAVGVLIYYKHKTLGSLELNAWGDSLAGVFAPLAFLWLVVGYAQQGDELRQNTEALKAQQDELTQQVVQLNRQASAAEWTVSASERRIQSELEHLVVVVGAQLESFATSCLTVAQDDGTDEWGIGRGTQGRHEPSTEPPEFDPLRLSVNWQVLPQELLQEVFMLAERRTQIGQLVSDAAYLAHDAPPEHTEYFWERRLRYAQLGLFVSQLASDMRAKVALPPLRAAEWPTRSPGERDQSLREIVEEIEAAKERHVLHLRRTDERAPHKD